MAAQISLIKAHIGYKNGGQSTALLPELNFDFSNGEMIGIVGLNGVGKSTLIKTISGLLPLIGGDITIAGEKIGNYTLQELARKVSVVLTDKFGGFNLNVFDVVAAGQIPYTDSFHRLKEKNNLIIEQAIERCGITSFKHKKVSELSDGMFQKTVIAKSLAQQTPVMLLDEPTAFLDYASKHALFLLLKDLVINDNKCILISSHDLDLLLKYCTKLLVLSGDKVDLIDTAEARNNSAFMEIGGGHL